MLKERAFQMLLYVAGEAYCRTGIALREEGRIRVVVYPMTAGALHFIAFEQPDKGIREHCLDVRILASSHQYADRMVIREGRSNLSHAGGD